MHRIPRKLIVILFIIAMLILAGIFLKDTIVLRFFSPTQSSLPIGIENSIELKDGPETLELIAENMNVPWDLALLPDGDLLVTERPGTLRRIGQNNQSFEIPEVTETSEGGLLGLALHPNFADNQHIYLYMTTDVQGGLTNQIVRYILGDADISEGVVIFGSIPGANTHDGGKIAFGPDGLLYVTTGDANVPELAQDVNSLAGKILRITDNGDIPEDNPFNNAVYSYGHRNSQGIAWDSKGRLWATEHGRSGARSGYDELNLIEKGVNYGWPLIQGDEVRDGLRRPFAHSGPDETWAPGGLAYADGELFFTGLRGSRLYQATIRDDNTVSIQTHFVQEYGRLRAATIAGDHLYISTSNSDGRGNPASNDDRIIKIPLSVFN